MSDLISRQAAIAYSISGITREIDGDKWIRVSEVRESIKTMPSAQLEHGRWITMSDANGIYYACSECGEELTRIEQFDPQFDLFPRLQSIDKTHFCPNCGALMDR